MHYLVLALLASVASAIQYSDAGMLCLVNKERSKNGLKPLGLDPRLCKSAVEHSQDQAKTGQMSHTGSDGSSPSQRIQDCGVNWHESGENVAYGYQSMEEVMNTWMNSPGHRANILGSQYTMFGSGIGTRGGTVYFTQDFANDGQGTRNVPKCDGSDQDSTNNGTNQDSTNGGTMDAMDNSNDSSSGNYDGNMGNNSSGGDMSNNYSGGDMGNNYSGGDMSNNDSGGDMGNNYSGGDMDNNNSYSGGRRHSRGGNNYSLSQGQDDNMSFHGGRHGGRNRRESMNNGGFASSMGGRGGNQGGHSGGHRNGRGGSYGGSSGQSRGGDHQSRGGSNGGGHRGGH